MNSRWDGFFGRVVISIVVSSVVVVSSVALVNRGINDRVHKIKRVAGLTVAPAPPGGANYLVIGSDTRAFATDQSDQESFGDPNDPSAGVDGQRSDTLMVAHVEPGPQKTFVVSFPRDLMVDVPGLPGKNQINSAYSSGGAQAVIDTLKANFDIDINHYLEVDFKTFQKIVDTIGSVRVFLPGNIRDPETGLASGPVTGCYSLNGGEALAYVRARSIQILDPNGTIVDPDTGEHWRLLDQRADLDRIGRQQQFIRKLAGLAISQSLNNPILGVELIDNVLSYISVDKGLSRDDVNALVRAFRTVDVNDQSSVRFETLPVDPYPADPNRVVASADAQAVIDQLNTFGDNAPKPAAVQPSQVSVQVVDATGTNIGQSVVSKLVEQGFHATSGATRTTKVPVTEIRYTIEQAAQAKALTTYFPDAKLVPDAKAGATVQLVLGSSFPGTITVPSTTTTTVVPSTVPGAPATTAPAPTTTTDAPVPSDPCA